MKKLMILGGLRYALPVIREAHDLGLYCIISAVLTFRQLFIDALQHLSAYRSPRM